MSQLWHFANKSINWYYISVGFAFFLPLLAVPVVLIIRVVILWIIFMNAFCVNFLHKDSAAPFPSLPCACWSSAFPYCSVFFICCCSQIDVVDEDTCSSFCCCCKIKGEKRKKSIYLHSALPLTIYWLLNVAQTKSENVNGQWLTYVNTYKHHNINVFTKLIPKSV